MGRTSTSRSGNPSEKMHRMDAPVRAVEQREDGYAKDSSQEPTGGIDERIVWDEV